MNLLAIETSTEQASIALMMKGKQIHAEQKEMRQHGQWLLPAIADLITAAGLSFSQLDGVVFGRGPGSFTGLRMACSAAQGLAFAHDLPVFAVSSLAAIAYTAHHRCSELGAPRPILTLMDARMQQVYWGFFSPNQYKVKEQVASPEHVRVEGVNEVVVAGVHFLPYIPLLPKLLQEKIINSFCVFPTAQAMIELVLLGQVPALSAAEALPVYIRNNVTQGNTNG